MPVDGGDHLDGHQRHRQNRREQFPIGQGTSSAAHKRLEAGAGGGSFAYTEIETFVGHHEAKLVQRGHVDEGRYMEPLVGRLPHDAVVSHMGRQQVAVQFAEGVAHLMQDGDERAVPVEAVIDAKRIEDIAEQPRQGQKTNASLGVEKSGAFELVFDPGLDGRAVARTVVAVEKAQEIKSVNGKKARFDGGLIQLAEVEVEIKHGMAQTVADIACARVNNLGPVDRGTRHVPRSSFPAVPRWPREQRRPRGPRRKRLRGTHSRNSCRRTRCDAGPGSIAGPAGPKWRRGPG